MHGDYHEHRDVILLAEGLSYFIFIGAAALIVTLVAHVR